MAATHFCLHRLIFTSIRDVSPSPMCNLLKSKKGFILKLSQKRNQLTLNRIIEEKNEKPKRNETVHIFWHEEMLLT